MHLTGRIARGRISRESKSRVQDGVPKKYGREPLWDGGLSPKQVDEGSTPSAPAKEIRLEGIVLQSRDLKVRAFQGTLKMLSPIMNFVKEATFAIPWPHSTLIQSSTE
jgi:hypothetical protein